MALQQQSAAQQALNTPELLEIVLGHLGSFQILQSQRVDTTFKSTILDSPYLRSKIFLNKNAKAGSTLQPRYTIFRNPFFVFDTAHFPFRNEWNMITNAPKFSYTLDFPLGAVNTDPTLYVHFFSKAEAFAMIQSNVLKHTCSWQNMFLTVPALVTTIKIIYPQIKRTERRELYMGGLLENAWYDETLYSCFTKVRVQPSTLGRMIRLAAKIVATDPEAWTNEVSARPKCSTGQILRLAFYHCDMDDSRTLANHLSRMELATEQEALGGLAAEEPELSSDRREETVTIEGAIRGTEPSTPRCKYLEDGLTPHERWYIDYGNPPHSWVRTRIFYREVPASSWRFARIAAVVFVLFTVLRWTTGKV